MTPAAQLIAELRAGAELVDTGSFELDPDEARRKLAACRFADREEFLIPLVEGLLALGAAFTTVKPVGADVVVIGDATAFAAESVERAERVLADLFSAPFSTSEGPTAYGLGRLAIGVHMALGRRGIAQVALEVRSPDWGLLACMTADGSVALTRLPGEEASVRIIVDGGHLAELEAVARDVHRVAFDKLRSATRFAQRLTIFVGDERVESKGWARLRNAVQHETVMAGIETNDGAPRLECLSYGVVVDSIPLEGAPPGFVAVASFDHPRRDLSQMKLVRDEAVEEAIEFAHRAARRVRRKPRPDQRMLEPPRPRRPVGPGLGLIALFLGYPLANGAVETQIPAARLDGWDPIVGTLSPDGAHYIYTYDEQTRRHSAEFWGDERPNQVPLWVRATDPKQVRPPPRLGLLFWLPISLAVTIPAVFVTGFRWFRSRDRSAAVRIVHLVLAVLVYYGVVWAITVMTNTGT